MTNVMGTTKATLEVLKWARQASNEDELVRFFWSELCLALSELPTATAERALGELRAYGGNTFANVFRGEGVGYGEVAYDVAMALKPMFADVPVSSADIESCEDYVLKMMKIESDDLQKLADAVRGSALKHSDRKGAVLAASGLVQVASQVLGRNVTQMMVTRVGAEIAKRVGLEIGKQIAGRIAMGVNVFGLAWTVVSIAGPAKRKTIPAVTYVALLRKLYLSAHDDGVPSAYPNGPEALGGLKYIEEVRV